MGMGISAAVPLQFRNVGFSMLEVDFAKSFIDNYDINYYSGERIYSIKKEVLFNNYKDFIYEFYELIGEDVNRVTRLSDISPNINNIEDFKTEFGFANSTCVPYVDNSRYFFTEDCDCLEYWVFYNGSFKIILEDEDTLSHFEKVLTKTMKNPLGRSIKFGMEGMG